MNTYSRSEYPVPAPTTPAYDMRLPRAVFIFIVVAAGCLCLLSTWIEPKGGLVLPILLLGVAVALAVALALLLQDRGDFRWMNRAELAQQHKLQVMAAETHMLKELGPNHPAAIARFGLPQPQTPAIAAPQTPTWNIDGITTPRALPFAVKNAAGEDVRADLVEVLLDLAETTEPYTNVREAIKERFPHVQFRADSLTKARAWMEERGIVAAGGKQWLVDADEARGILMHARLEAAQILTALPAPRQ